MKKATGVFHPTYQLINRKYNKIIEFVMILKLRFKQCQYVSFNIYFGDKCMVKDLFKNFHSFGRCLWSCQLTMTMFIKEKGSDAQNVIIRLLGKETLLDIRNSPIWAKSLTVQNAIVNLPGKKA